MTLTPARKMSTYNETASKKTDRGIRSVRLASLLSQNSFGYAFAKTRRNGLFCC